MSCPESCASQPLDQRASCIVTCDSSCDTTCRQGLDPEIQYVFLDVAICAMAECSGAAADRTCMVQRCQEEYVACLSEGAMGDATCQATSQCIGEAPAGDDESSHFEALVDCMELSAADQIAPLMALTSCMAAHDCGDADAVAQCIEANCAAEWMSCFPDWP